MKKTYKIAILSGFDVGDGCDGYLASFVGQHITEWTEVDEATYLLARKYAKEEGKIVLVQEPAPAGINELVAQWRAKEAEGLAAKAQAAELRTQKALAREAKKKAKREAEELKQLRELQAKYGQVS
jgi:hypothetical protein